MLTVNFLNELNDTCYHLTYSCIFELSSKVNIIIYSSTIKTNVSFTLIIHTWFCLCTINPIAVPNSIDIFL